MELAIKTPSRVTVTGTSISVKPLSRRGLDICTLPPGGQRAYRTVL
jgi:hypothetical protein